MTARLRVLLCAVAALVVLGAAPAAAQDSGRSFEIESMVVLARVNPDASMDVVEQLTYDFDGEFNGGTRTIPAGDYQIVDFRVTENGETRDLAPGFSDPNFGNEVRWFGSADHSEVSGRHTYDLSYRVLDAAEVFPDVGVLNWQFVGDDFPAMQLVQVDVTMPGDGTDLRAFAHGDLRGVVVPEGNTVHLRVPENPAGSPVEVRIVVPSSVFTVPPSGSPTLDGILAEEAALAATANAARGQATEAYAAEVARGMEPVCEEESSDALDAACERLADLLEEAGSPGNGEPIDLADAEIYFGILQARRDIQDEADRIVAARERRLGNIAAPIITVSVVLAWYVFWRKVGKEYDRPEDVGDYWREVPEQSPAVVAAIEGWGVVDSHAFANTVLDLAQRGWLTITEEGTGHRFTRSQQTTDELPLRDYESKALWRLFEDGRPTVTQDELVDEATDDRAASATWMGAFKVQIQHDYSQQHIQEKKGCGPIFFHVLLVLVLAGTCAVAIAFGAWVGAAVAGAAALLLLPLGGLLRRRTPTGNRKHAEVQGLKRFLRDFSLVDDVPVGHLALYERYLVYAVALGVADKLIAGLRMRFPELASPQSGFAPWYIGAEVGQRNFAGGIGGYDRLASVGTVGAFASDFSRVTASAFSVPSSSSGSGGGFSGGGGGGFSGGGGGGGAGAW